MDGEIENLVERSVFILREIGARFKRPAVLWSTGKDSTATLSLIREAFFGAVPWPVIHIDTGFKFPEIYRFRDQVAREWGLNLIVARNEEHFGRLSPFNAKRFQCCTKLKTEALKQAIHREGFDVIVVSIRRDEHGIRGKERYMSPRDRDFRWNVYRAQNAATGDSGLEALQDAELSGWGLYSSDFGPDCDHVRVHPILHWTELDVWRYVRDRKLPLNPLYFAKGGLRYRSLGCKPCTQPIKSEAKTIDEIIEEIGKTPHDERAGRAQDKEEAYMMQKLRTLGYM